MTADRNMITHKQCSKNREASIGAFISSEDHFTQLATIYNC